MNDVFRPYLRRFVLVFFNDILIYNRTLCDHLGPLDVVMMVLILLDFTHSTKINLQICVEARFYFEKQEVGGRKGEQFA